MNITLTRNNYPCQPPHPRYVVNLARKLQACATGHYSAQPTMLFLTQATALAEMAEVRHSILASLEEVESFA